MKKHLSIYLFALAAAAFSMVSCSKDTEGLTWITYYPEISISGDEYMMWEAGKAFVDPGYTATLDGEDISANVEVSTRMNLSSPQPGFYSIDYQVENADGIMAGASRYVIVAAAGDQVSGYYYTQPDSFRDYNGVVHYGGYFEYIYSVGDGEYFVSDLLGGWYQYRAGYGANYAMQGWIAVNDDNSVEMLDSYISGWGDGLDYMENGTFDPASGTISYDIAYANMPFTVIMQK